MKIDSMKMHIILSAILILAISAIISITGITTALADPVADGAALIEEEKFEEAREHFKELTKERPDDAEVRYYYGRALLGDGDHDKAIKEFKKAIDLDDTVSSYHRWLGMAYVEKLDHSSFIKKKSIAGNIKKSFEHAVAADPENTRARESLAHFYFEAPGFAGGDRDKALEQIAEIEKRDVEKALYVRGDYYRHFEEWDDAIATYRKIEPSDDNDVTPLTLIARTCILAERYAEGMGAYQEAYAMDPTSYNSLYGIGRTAAVSGEFLDSGEAAMLEYVTKDVDPKLHNTHASAHWRLGNIYEHMGRKEDALAQYDRALKLDPDHDLAKKSRKKLRRKKRK